MVCSHESSVAAMMTARGAPKCIPSSRPRVRSAASPVTKIDLPIPSRPATSESAPVGRRSCKSQRTGLTVIELEGSVGSRRDGRPFILAASIT